MVVVVDDDDETTIRAELLSRNQAFGIHSQGHQVRVGSVR